MRTYACTILERAEVKTVCGEDRFLNDYGFYSPDVTGKQDYWNMLEKHLGHPIVSLRSGGKAGWDEYLILTAEGDLVEGKPRLKGCFEYLKDVLFDIFLELNEDECNIFSHYLFDTTEEDYNKLLNWMKNTYGYKVLAAKTTRACPVVSGVCNKKLIK